VTAPDVAIQRNEALKMSKIYFIKNRWTLTIAAVVLALLATVLSAQEGHPLNGSWSGERMVDGKASRILLIMELHKDQMISGYVLENGKKSALQDVTLNTDAWSVSFALEQGYKVEGAIGELGSQTQRTITGTWTDGSKNGAFHVDIN
jgi:hypothetical protein